MVKIKRRPTKQATRPRDQPRFCDTTIVYYRLHGHALLVDAILKAKGAGALVLSNFVRGEYIRGYIYGLTLLHAAVRSENSVHDGVEIFVAENRSKHRRIQNALTQTAEWLGGHDDSHDVETYLDRLGNAMRNCLQRLDEEFPTRVRDPMACEHGVLNFPSTTFSEDHVLDLYEQIRAIRDAPGCQQCSFREDQIQRIQKDRIDLTSPAQQQKYIQHTGYIGQVQYIDKATTTKRSGPSCWYCDVLGDTIIALQCPNGHTLLTGDRASFPALAEILDKPLILVPSLLELKRARDAGNG